MALLSLIDVPDADFDRVEPGQDIELGDCEPRKSIDTNSVPESGHIDPAVLPPADDLPFLARPFSADEVERARQLAEAN
ncbi:MAG: hypothetical protein ACNA8W_25450, partial [Bradymonadaceae bacterium]